MLEGRYGTMLDKFWCEEDGLVATFTKLCHQISEWKMQIVNNLISKKRHFMLRIGGIQKFPQEGRRHGGLKRMKRLINRSFLKPCTKKSLFGFRDLKSNDLLMVIETLNSTM